MSSTGKRRQQKTPDGACLSEEAVNPRGTEEGPSLPAARNGIPFPEATAYPLLEKMLERSNMIRAYKRVVANGGAPGVDGVDVKSLQSHLADHWEAIKQELRNGTYRPAPVKKARHSEARRQDAEAGDSDHHRPADPAGVTPGVDPDLRPGIFGTQLRVPAGEKGPRRRQESEAIHRRRLPGRGGH